MDPTESASGVVLDKHIHFVDCTAYKMTNPIYFGTIRDPVDRFVSRYYTIYRTISFHGSFVLLLA